jgi:Rrf2 family protein
LYYELELPVLYQHAAGLAVRAALCLAQQRPGSRIPVREIARAANLSAPYLAKIINRLHRAGLVRTFRGPGGGVALAREAAQITLWEIVQAVESPAADPRCALGIGLCSEERPCPLHDRWVPLRDGRQRLLEETTLAALAQGLRSMAEAVRLSDFQTEFDMTAPYEVPGTRRKKAV